MSTLRSILYLNYRYSLERIIILYYYKFPYRLTLKMHYLTTKIWYEQKLSGGKDHSQMHHFSSASSTSFLSCFRNCIILDPVLSNAPIIVVLFLPKSFGFQNLRDEFPDTRHLPLWFPISVSRGTLNFPSMVSTFLCSSL